MTVAMKKQLDESLRDAQLAFYLHKIAPGKSLPGTVRLKTARDLYEYWLLDVLVSQDVPTTPVACAIASLQQYINRILMNMEPGYDQANITPEQMQTWRNEMHQYPVWAAHQKLLYFPASYLDPVLRNNKSDNFQQLENELNQNRIQTDAVQSAVMAYLTRFEEIANLNILNGYIDGADFANSTYYFIAKSRTESTYFWRSLNMGQRPLDGTLPPPPAVAAKLDQPDPNAWSDWEKTDVPISESAVEHSIRPVWFNNRLFVIWAECIHQDQSASNASSAAEATPHHVSHPLLRLCYCFKKQDGSWSTPRVGLQGYCNDDTLADKDMDTIKSLVNTVAVPHRKDASDVLFLSLCAYEPKAETQSSHTDNLIFIGTTCICRNLLSLPVRLATTKGTAQDKYNAYSTEEKSHIDSSTRRFQTRAASQEKIIISDATQPRNMKLSKSDIFSYQKQITFTTPSFRTLRIATNRRLTPPVHSEPYGKTITFSITSSAFRTPRVTLELNIPAERLAETPYIRLSLGSRLHIVHDNLLDERTHTLSLGDLTDVLKDNKNSPGFKLSNSNKSLYGRFISTAALRYLMSLVDSGVDDRQGSTHIEGIKLQEKTSEPYDFGKISLSLSEQLLIQYVILRPDSTPETTHTKLTVKAESSAGRELPNAFEYTWNEGDISDNDIVYCGIALIRPSEPEKKIYSALKAIKIKLAPTTSKSPDIKSTSSLGTIQYIDFANSSIEKNDTEKQKRQPIRLNTVFVTELISRTESSLNELFDYTTQLLPEPAIPGETNNEMDFHGPYGRYFTELFLYLPWLVAHRLNAEQRYEEAERWLRRVFDPGLGQERCWRAVPLINSSTPSYVDQAPHDPHQIALSHPAHFRKALYFLYLDILINRGDAAYRELTPDSLSEAKLWYVRVLDLLGPRPIVQTVDHWTVLSLQALSEETSGDLRDFEKSSAHSQPSGSVHEGTSHPSLPTIDSPHLRLPFHPQLLRCWDIAESRLYNLRHNLDIAGKPLHLPIFAAPLDPRVLLSPAVLNTLNNTVRRLPGTAIPHYRFSVMHNQALSAVESLSQFGATLLSLIERKEQAQLQELQQQQAWNLAKISVDLQRQAVNIDCQNRQALLASQAIAQNRLTHYKKLLDDGLSRKEMDVSVYSISSGSFEAAALAFQVAAGYTMLAPNMVGIGCVGGSRWEGPLLSASAAAHSAAIINRTIAADLDRQAIFDRRREDWSHAYDQSQLELAQIDAQLAQFTEQETATRLQLRLAETTLSQTKANYDFLSKRFTKAQLYQWLNSQFAALYRLAYDTTLALCFATENCWQYEIADFTRRFIQPDTWNTTYRGLGAGEQLKLSLLNMQVEYLRRSERELEIRKTISLRQLQSRSTDSAINKQWADIQANLLKTGKCDFELTHKLFEDDYKEQKHYLRRIKTISVSLPAVVGPYENIRATLTQVSSKVFMSPDDSSNVMKDLRANQQIALSTGVDDNGLFTLNFNDERYLPFEYTGAISKWQLTFPNPEAQKDLLESLTDIIVHVSYTARAGGAQ
ncbi:toxin [Pseudomonas sp. SWRI12]|uniref:Toxin n=1 Tax=Pseudomonas zanjanensis TaxID=2745496 RepID=A0A923FCY5_9PSED|nr:neuraminidase-like domain-containing protein [Pseudomonas zanjanensis]MBV4498812.1 toxin [Pseudomonas zanjanensis]